MSETIRQMAPPDPSTSERVAVTPLLDQWIAVFEDEAAHGVDHRRVLQALREAKREAALSVDRERDDLAVERMEVGQVVRIARAARTEFHRIARLLGDINLDPLPEDLSERLQKAHDVAMGAAAGYPVEPDRERDRLVEENERLRAVREAAVRVVNAEDWRSGQEWDEALVCLVEALSSSPTEREVREG